MNLGDTQRPSLTPSSIQQVKLYSSKFYFKRFLEVVVCLLLYKTLIYWVHSKLYYSADDETNFFNVLHEYAVSILLVHNISSELFSQVEYRVTYVKHVLVRSVRILLMFYDAVLISASFGLTHVSNEPKGTTCFYFFPGKITMTFSSG